MPVPVPVSGVTRFMTSGWAPDQQDLRWPPVPGEDAWPPGPADGAWPPGGDVRGDEPGSYEPGSYESARGSGDQWAADPGTYPGAGDPWNAGPGFGDSR